MMAQGTLTSPPAAESALELARSAEFCRRLTKEKAKNFYYGLKLTPEHKRPAMYAVYAWMRAADDVADDEGEAEIKNRRLQAFRSLTLAAMREDGSEFRELLVAAASEPHAMIWPAVRQMLLKHQVPREYLLDMIEGQLLDQHQLRYERFEQLRDYCYKVASVVGLTCIHIWGYSGGEATRRLAEARGIALQLTNIIRDIPEDAERGRVYLPEEDLQAAGLTREQFLMLVQHRQASPEMEKLLRQQVDRARAYYQESSPLEQFIDPDCRGTSWTLMRIYERLLEKIAQDPLQVLSQRVRLSGFEKAWIAWQGMTPAQPRLPADTQGNKSHPSRQPRHVLVVGGGLAGMAAAVQLTSHGHRVTLVETRQRLGGRATSFTDPASQLELDNCQHVLMGCCTSLLDLYQKLGVQDQVDWHRKLYFTDARGRWDELERDDLPAPLHMAWSMLSFRTLSLWEKIALGRGMAAIMRTSRKQRDQLHSISFGQWLQMQDQPASLRRKFWDNIVTGALNETPDRVACDYALQVFQDGFLCHEDAYVMGLARVPLSELYSRLQTLLQGTGGELQLSTSADQLLYDPASKRIAGLRLSDAQVLQADAYVSAVPFDRVLKLSGPELRRDDRRLDGLDQFEVSPIIGIHLWLGLERADQPVVRLPHAVLMESPLHWIFNKGVEPSPVLGGKAGGRKPAGHGWSQHLHGVISAARQWVDQPAEQIVDMVVQEIRKAMPSAKDAPLLHAKVVKEKRATFAAKPGISRIRPAARGETANLYLAGDYCQSGWPATMEGAVRSGYIAAGALLEDWGQGNPGLPADLKPTAIYQCVSG